MAELEVRTPAGHLSVVVRAAGMAVTMETAQGIRHQYHGWVWTNFMPLRIGSCGINLAQKELSHGVHCQVAREPEERLHWGQ